MNARIAMRLNSKGQCPNCLRKPLLYQRPDTHFFCFLCCRQYDESGEQKENWAWRSTGNDQFMPTYPTHDYVSAKPTAGAQRRAAKPVLSSTERDHD